MKKRIRLATIEGIEPHDWLAIVQGDLALHPAPALDSYSFVRDAFGRVVWAITHVPTGAAVIRIVGCHDARRTFRRLSGIAFDRPGPALVKRINQAFSELARTGVRFYDHPGTPKARAIKPEVVSAWKGVTQ